MTLIDKERFGPWAVVTGAPSGIGKEFARQLAASGINVVLVARRGGLLESVAAECSAKHGVRCRTVVADLSEEGFLATLTRTTADLDVGLVVSNAGTAVSGEFLELDHAESTRLMRLNTFAHHDLSYHYGRHLVARGRGGLLLCGAMGAIPGIPYLSNASASKAYVQVLGQCLHAEWAPRGVNVTVLVVGPTATPVVEKLGIDAEKQRMKPMSAEQCVSEALRALQDNRAIHINGRLNRVMNAVVPDAVKRAVFGKMMKEASLRKAESRSSPRREDA